MTYEEAKVQIQAIPEKIWDQLSEPDREAMEMAFSALQEQDVPDTNVGDMISRQAAIDAAIKADMENNSNVLSEKRAGVIDRHISAVPSAQPERKNGRWKMKPDPFGFFGEIPVCSECGYTTKMRDKTKFCPHCGAQMEGQ